MPKKSFFGIAAIVLVMLTGMAAAVSICPFDGTEETEETAAPNTGVYATLSCLNAGTATHGLVTHQEAMWGVEGDLTGYQNYASSSLGRGSIDYAHSLQMDAAPKAADITASKALSLGTGRIVTRDGYASTMALTPVNSTLCDPDLACEEFGTVPFCDLVIGSMKADITSGQVAGQLSLGSSALTPGAPMAIDYTGAVSGTGTASSYAGMKLMQPGTISRHEASTLYIGGVSVAFKHRVEVLHGMAA